MINHEPPWSVEAEVAVIGSLLIDRDAIVEVADWLKPVDFYRQAHALIYQVILDLWEKGQPADIVLVGERLKADGNLDLVGGTAYLSSLTNETPTSVYVGSYARIVQKKGILRQLIGAAGKISQIAYEEPDDIESAVDRAQETVFDIGTTKRSSGYTALRPLLHEAYDTLDHLHQHRGTVTGLSTGFLDLDSLTQGFQPSDLIILAARPSVGKTSLALNIAEHMTVNEGKSVGFFSLEMSKEQLVLRILSSVSNVDSQNLRTGYIEPDSWQRIANALGVLDKASLYIDDTPAMTIGEMRTKARRMQMEVGIDLLLVDYLQLMQAPGAAGRDGNRVQEVSAISRGLKALARELRVPVVALSQLSRAVDGRESSEPRLSDLRESGAIEQDADLVMFLWRHRTADDAHTNPEGEVINAKLAKHRNGPIGEFKLYFRRTQTKFESYAETSTEHW